jgi:hypothetical protein
VEDDATLLLGYTASTRHGIATLSTPPPTVSPAVRPSLSFAHRARVRNGDTDTHGHSLDAPYRETAGHREAARWRSITVEEEGSGRAGAPGKMG